MASRRLAMLVRVAAFSLLVGAPVARVAGEAPSGVTRETPASWIEWLPVPAANRARLRAVEDGQYTLLTDTQMRMPGPLNDTFRRDVIKVVDRAGLEQAAQEQIVFDPSQERLVIDRIAIWRDGKMIDRTKSASIDLLRRESELDDGVLTGERTALVRLDDVRVGDVVDYAWTWHETASAWPGQLFTRAELGWSVPVGLTRFRLTMPANRPLFGARHNGAPQSTVTRDGTMLTRDWRLADPDPVADADRSPHSWFPWANVTLSTLPSWRAVDQWAQAKFDRDLTLPAGFTAKLDAIAAHSRDPGVRAVAALRLIQDTIRYTSLSIASGAFVPRTPAETVRTGFGDCKDKSLLLVAALRHLGIEAWPALTDSDDGPALIRHIPSANVFDHAIVLARIGGKDHWFDATGNHEGGALADLAPLPYGYALPIRPGQDRLQVIPAPVPSLPTAVAVETYRRSSAGLTLDVVTDYIAADADDVRDGLADHGIAHYEKNYFDYYRDKYPGLTMAHPLVIEDDRAADHLRTRESYRLAATATDYAATLKALPVAAATVRDLYQSAGKTNRDAPIALPQPVNRKHVIVLDTPGFRPTAPEEGSVHGPAFDLDETVSRKAHMLTATYHLVSKQAVLPGRDAAAFDREVGKLNDDTSWTLDLTVPASDGDTSGLFLAIVLPCGLAGIGVLVSRRMRKRRRDAQIAALKGLPGSHVPRTAAPRPPAHGTTPSPVD